MPYCRTCGAEISGPFCSACGTPAAAPAGQAPPPAAPQQQPPVMPRRKTSPIVWILIVLLSLFILVGLALAAGVAVVSQRTGLTFSEIARDPAYAAARMAMVSNPNLEEIGHGDGAITLRDRRTGKTAIVRFGDLRSGGFRFSAESGDGQVATLEAGPEAARLPSWIPLYPGAEPSGGLSASGGDQGDLKEGGTAVYTTPDPGPAVIAFYEGKASSMGMRVGVVTHGSDSGFISMNDDSMDRRLAIAVSGRRNGRTRISLTYGSKQ